jgi:hypothetical protein
MKDTTTLKANKIGEKTLEEKKVEIYKFNIKLAQEDKERFKNNPLEFMKELMERNGLKVNGIDGDKDAIIRSIEEEARFEWMHISAPEEMFSQWRYVYVPSDGPTPSPF